MSAIRLRPHLCYLIMHASPLCAYARLRYVPTRYAELCCIQRRSSAMHMPALCAVHPDARCLSRPQLAVRCGAGA
eukprot:1270732-Rhodomonas_salina.1